MRAISDDKMKRRNTKHKTRRPFALDVDRGQAERKFSRVVNAFSHTPDVVFGGGKGFGSNAFRINGKIFAMMSSQGQCVMKLPKSRVDELIACGEGQHFEPRPGRLMKEWIVLSKGGNWLKLSREALEFAKLG